MLKESDLHSYQKKMVKLILDKLRVGLFVDMGMGKTVSSLTAVKKLRDCFFINKVLIIAPLKVANSVWHNECKKWEHLKDIKVNICTGTSNNRIKNINDYNAFIYVINRENIKWLINQCVRGVCKWKWDYIIIDESSSFKSHSTERFKVLKNVVQKIKGITLLTGTPSPNGQMDLWSQVYLLDGGDRLGKTITKYRNNYFIKSFDGFSYKLRDGADKLINEKLSDICFSLKSDDYLDLPEKINVIEKISLSKECLNLYKRFERDFIMCLKDKVIAITKASTLSNKLLQICNGTIYDEEGNMNDIHNLKIERLKEIIDDNPNDNFLVAYNYKSDLKKIIKNIKGAVKLENDKQIVDWNNGKIKVMLVHPASAGHGLNLQFGGNIIIWYGLNWNLELYQQLNKRLHRQGQSKPVRIIHLVVSGGIDEKVMLALNSKAKTQSELLNYLKLHI